MNKFNIYIEQNRIFSNSKLAIALEQKSKFGEKKSGLIIYSPYEAFYLYEKNRAKLIKNNKPLTNQNIIKSISKDKNFFIKYLVYKKLKNKGYVIKTGLKFGGEFRVYEKKSFIKNKHAKYICIPIKQTEKIDPKEIISKIRVTHSTGKKLLLAIIDSEEDVTFYEIDWIKI